MKEAAVVLVNRHVFILFAAVFMILTILSCPKQAFAGQAWDVIKYDATPGTIISDTFAYTSADQNEPFAGCSPYPYCSPMWRNSLTSGSPGAPWAVVGAADFDLNGTADLVFQNASTGQVSVSFFQGSFVRSFLSSASLPCPGSGWMVEAVGDLNGDGYPDILYFNPGTGAREVYFYGGAQGITQLGSAAPILPLLQATQRVAAIADINGDGQADLITQDSITANVQVSYLSPSSGFTGFSITGSDFMNAQSPVGWVVVGALDANGDDQPDLFFKNTSTGEVTVDFFEGAHYLGWADVEQVKAQKQLFLVPRIKPAGPSRVLLFIGAGATGTSYFALEREMDAMELNYDTASSNGEVSASVRLNYMNQAQLNAYQLLIVPGGQLGPIVVNWKESTRQKIQAAVLKNGVSYLGICAGAFVAGDPDPYLNLTGLPLVSWWNSFDFYSAYYVKKVTQGIVQVSLPTGSQFGSPMQVFWSDGPELQGFGDVIAKYPDGTAAVAEKAISPNGFIVLSGVHPEAPTDWIRSQGLALTANPIQTDIAFAASLINAALTKTPLPHF